MMIRTYTPEDFQYLHEWVSDARLLFTFSGPEWHFPLTEEQVENHRRKHLYKQLYVGVNDQDVPFALGELIWNEPNSPRLGRLLIGDPGQRGQGLGTRFIRELINEFVRLHDPENICLYVFDQNAAAIRCYQKLGFRFNEEPPKVLHFNGETLFMLKMTLHLK